MVVLIVAMYQIFTTGTKVELGINQGIALTFAAFGLWIFASIQHMLHNFKKSLMAILGAAAVFVIFIVAYSTATPVVMDNFPDVSASMTKVISGGLVTVYVLGAACIILAVYSEVLAIFKS
jgi:uncharacterized membrane protein YozB (DUF420 family)